MLHCKKFAHSPKATRCARSPPDSGASLAKFRSFFAWLVAAALATACAAPGPYDQPYSLVESGAKSAVRKELPVIISAVDGETTFARGRPGPIKPGKHVLDVYFAAAAGPYFKRRQPVELDAAPCTRYRIVARYTNLTHIEWSPIIYPEPVGECLARFGPMG